jgi:acetyl esterase/lipase
MARINRRTVIGALLGTAALAAAGYGGWRGYRWFTTVPADFADVPYGAHERQVFDVYLPKGQAAPFPFVFEIHGGAFKIGSKSMSAPPQQLLDAGIAVVRPNYRYSSTDIWPAQGQDCLAALQAVLAKATEFGLDPARFAVWGQSAGGFLAVSTGLSMVELGTPPRAVVDFYGPMDFSTMDADMQSLGRSAAMGATNDASSAESQLLGYAVGDDPAAAKAIGPIGRLEVLSNQTLPPLFARHGDADPMIAQGQTERLVAEWRRVDPSAAVDFALLPGGGHGGGDFETDVTLGPLRDFLLGVFQA